MTVLRLIIVLACLIPAPLAKAADIAIALTEDRIEIDTNFAGAELTLFGAITGADNPSQDFDIIAVLTGPDGDFTVRALEQRGLIWLPGARQLIENAPRFYASHATRPISEIAPLPDQAQHQLGIENIAAVDLLNDTETQHPYNAAFLDTLEQIGQYKDNIGGVTFFKEKLFTINAALPSNTPIGDYRIAVYLYRDGVLINQDSAALKVNKVGLERRIYDLAHRRPILYGLLCVAVSLLAGWIAGLAFRKS